MILAPTLTLSAGSGAAIARPTFSRDFAGEKTLNNGTGPAITFTRASNATYFDASGVLQTAANNVPRFDHDPATAGNPSRGLLIEEARTNLLERSAEFDDAYWNKTTTTVTANDATSPAGTATADLVEKTGNETTTPGRTLAVTAAAHTLSVFVKNNSGNRLRLRIDATGGTIVDAIFNTDAGAVVSSSAGVTATITSVGGGWYRCAATYTFASAVNASIGFSPRNEGADATGAKAWLWGAQLEQGAFPTSYIPTTTAAATRSADSAVVTPISGFYNQSEGTLFAEVREGGSDLQYGAVSLDTDTSDNRIDLRRNNDASFITMIVTTSGAAQMLQSPVLAVAAQIYKLIGAYKTNDCAVCVNGGSIAPDASVTLPTLTHLRIGGLAATSPATGNAFSANGHIRRIAYYPKRLSNTLLQQLTT